MGRKLDFLLCRSSRQTSKLKTLLSVTVSRLAVLRNQRQARCSLARSDVAQLLELCQQERALLRSEQVIKEQTMLDAFVLIEGYCHLLTERSALLGRISECPDELKEAISGLVFAASRCGELPELLKLRYIFASKFGREFTSAAVELRNNCSVNPKLIQKLSTRNPTMEIKIRVTKEIAAEKGIKLDLGVEPPIVMNQDVAVRDGISENGKQQYRDVATAAQAAFISASHAAAAARAAVELSRTESQPKDPHDHNAHTGGSEFDARNPQKNDKGNIIQSDKAMEKSDSKDEKTIGLSSESIDTRELLYDKSNCEVRNEYEERIKHKPSYLRAPYQKSNPGRTHGDNLLPKTLDDFDSKDRLGSGIVDEYAIYHYTEKLNEQHSSLGQKPVSVRTRRGL